MKHKHYDLAYNAHRNTSFSPEKRAETHCQWFDERQEEFAKLGASAKAVEKLESLWVDWMNAKSRCMSSMITGPARFPVAKAEKANNSEHNKSTAYFEYFDKVKNAIEKEKYYEKHPEERPISVSDSDALERLKSKLDTLEELQETMKAANKIMRKEGKEASNKFLEESGVRDGMESHWKRDCFFESFQLTNNNAKIKRVKGQIAELERAKEADSTEEEVAEGVSYTKDTDSMRIYFEFDGKPGEDTRFILKRNGFRWTPSKGHWGRKLTANAEYSAAIVSEALGKAA